MYITTPRTVGLTRSPPGVTTAAKTSDGYLVQIAKAAGLNLATFDGRLSDPVVVLIR